MSNYNFVAVFNYEGIPEVIKGIARAEYMKCYNIFADASESLYKKWYKEFDSTFGKLDNYNTPQCNRWLAKKAEAWCLQNITSKFMEFTFDPENMTMDGHLKMIPKSKINFYLKEGS